MTRCSRTRRPSTTGRVLAAGLFNFSLFYIAFVFGGFQYLEPLLDYNLIDPDRWIGPATAVACCCSSGTSPLWA